MKVVVGSGLLLSLSLACGPGSGVNGNDGGAIEGGLCAEECGDTPGCNAEAARRFDPERGCSAGVRVCVRLSPGPDAIADYEAPNGDCISFSSGEAPGDWTLIDGTYAGDCPPEGAFENECSAQDGGE